MVVGDRGPGFDNTKIGCWSVGVEHRPRGELATGATGATGLARTESSEVLNLVLCVIIINNGGKGQWQAGKGPRDAGRAPS